MNIGIKRIIALIFAVSLVIFSGIQLWFSKEIPETFQNAVTSVIAFYFAKGSIVKENE